MVELNDSAAEILNTIGDRASAQQVVSTLTSCYPEHDIENDIIEFLNEALTENWLEYA